MGKNLYVNTWRKYEIRILHAIRNDEATLLDRIAFESVGNRVKSGYNFKLVIENGIIPRNDSSAVARDLKLVLDENTEFKKYANGKKITIKFSNFRFYSTSQMLHPIIDVNKF